MIKLPERKSQRLKRLVKIQRQKEKIAGTDLAYILAQQRQAEHSVTSVLDALGTVSPLHSTFAPHYSKRLTMLEMAQKKLGMHRAAQEKKMLTERAKADRLDEKLQDANQSDVQEEEEEALQDLIDLLAASAQSSSR